MLVPSAVISVAICSEEISLSKRALLHVQHLAAQRQDGLETCGRVPAWRSRRPNRPRRCTARTWPGRVPGKSASLPGSPAPSRHALASRHLAARAPGRFARPRRVDDLAADDARIGRPLQQERPPATRPTTSSTAGRTSEDTSLSLGLRAELGLGNLHAEHAGQPLAHVVAGGFRPWRAWRIRAPRCTCSGTRVHRSPQPRDVRAAVPSAGCLLVNASRFST